MARPTQRVRPYKREEATQGGNAADSRPFPKVLDPQTDATDSAGSFFQEAGTADNQVVIYREENQLIFEDPHTGYVSLFEIWNAANQRVRDWEDRRSLSPQYTANTFPGGVLATDEALGTVGLTATGYTDAVVLTWQGAPFQRIGQIAMAGAAGRWPFWRIGNGGAFEPWRQLGVFSELGNAPSAIGASNSAGTSDFAARLDHVHAHGNQAGGALHSAAIASSGGIGGANGFFTAQEKEKLNGIATGATNTSFSSATPAKVAAAGSAGSAVTAARSDHVHAAGPFVILSILDTSSGVKQWAAMPTAETELFNLARAIYRPWVDLTNFTEMRLNVMVSATAAFGSGAYLAVKQSTSAALAPTFTAITGSAVNIENTGTQTSGWFDISNLTGDRQLQIVGGGISQSIAPGAPIFGLIQIQVR